MQPGFQFSATDREDLRRRGIPVTEAERQLELLRDPPPAVELIRACRPEDGITALVEEDWTELESCWDRFARKARLVKFVPASGAATRMFSFATTAAEALGDPTSSQLAEAAGRGSDAARLVLELLERVDEAPFSAELSRVARAHGTTTADLRRRPLRLMSLITDPHGLGLASLPKGLIPFHGYGNDSRTALEEHLHEAAGYARGRDGSVVVHFTVAPEHLRSFEKAAQEALRIASAATDAQFELEFSTQDPETDTLGLGVDGSPLRTDQGHLLFRPAGHGALINNLGRLDADVAFIKNIDNIAPADRHRETAAWKRRLGGHLLRLRSQAFGSLDRLERGATGAALEALTFCNRYLALRLPELLQTEAPDDLRSFLIERLDRPLRVCGVVRNQGEPGGGPFWVADPGDVESGQIVEASQVDGASDGQTKIFRSASHFNPVDVVCSLRDRQGRPYDLARFTDPAASFVSSKHQGGRAIRALERPGLWNGAMARWNTAFVEVPLTTFTPVKNLLDLLRPEHQPAG